MRRRSRTCCDRTGSTLAVLSAGGTGTYDITGVNPAVTELQAGSYVFMDAFHGNLVPGFEVSLTVLTSVMATARRHRHLRRGPQVGRHRLRVPADPGLRLRGPILRRGTRSVRHRSAPSPPASVTVPGWSAATRRRPSTCTTSCSPCEGDRVVGRLAGLPARPAALRFPRRIRRRVMPHPRDRRIRLLPGRTDIVILCEQMIVL